MKPGDVTLLLTRPEPAARRFAARCIDRLGPFADVVIAPLMRIAPLPLPEIAPDAVLAFTSENGVAAASAQGLRAHLAWCVGARTAEAARDAGFEAIAGGGDAAALAEAILAAPERPSSQRPILHLAGRHQRGDLVERLRAQGLTASRHVVYEQHAMPLSPEARDALSRTRPMLVPLFSPRSAALLSAALPEPPRAPLLLAHLGPAVAADWKGPVPAATGTAERPDAEALIDVVDRLLADSQGA